MPSRRQQLVVLFEARTALLGVLLVNLRGYSLAGRTENLPKLAPEAAFMVSAESIANDIHRTCPGTEGLAKQHQ